MLLRIYTNIRLLSTTTRNPPLLYANHFLISSEISLYSDACSLWPLQQAICFPLKIWPTDGWPFHPQQRWCWQPRDRFCLRNLIKEEYYILYVNCPMELLIGLSEGRAKAECSTHAAQQTPPSYFYIRTNSRSVASLGAVGQVVAQLQGISSF